MASFTDALPAPSLGLRAKALSATATDASSVSDLDSMPPDEDASSVQSDQDSHRSPIRGSVFELAFTGLLKGTEHVFSKSVDVTGDALRASLSGAGAFFDSLGLDPQAKRQQEAEQLERLQIHFVTQLQAVYRGRLGRAEATRRAAANLANMEPVPGCLSLLIKSMGCKA